MKTLEVTDEQYALIQELREDIAREVVGKYGYVRERDVVQFLLDNLDDDFDLASDLSAGEAHGTAVAYDEGDDTIDPAGEADDTDPEEVDGNPDEDEPGADETGSDETGSDGETTDDSATEEGDEDEDTADEAVEAEDTAGEGDEDEAADEDAAGEETLDGEEDADDASSDDATGEGGAADDDDMLDAMMNLLETHDDKWGEASSADYRYSVELPDGSTERVQTKDDVRALLFKNYR